MNQRDFMREGENIHQRLIEEIFKKDKQTQAQFREQFTTQPAAFREQMERIEAGAKASPCKTAWPSTTRPENQPAR